MKEVHMKENIFVINIPVKKKKTAENSKKPYKSTKKI